MGMPLTKVSTYDFFSPLIYYYLTFDGMAFLLP